MSFADKMQVAAFVLESAKVVLGYSVTIPLLVGFLCWLFRKQVGRAIDSMGEASWGKASVKLRERAALAEYNVSADQAKTATIYATVKGITEAASRGQEVAPPTISPEHQEKVLEAIASFFTLAARLLPLIPKVDRRVFIEAETATLPPEFARFRDALFRLAERAPEVPTARGLSDQLTFGLSDKATVEVIKPPTTRSQ
jgi:hypothetical protein